MTGPASPRLVDGCRKRLIDLEQIVLLPSNTTYTMAGMNRGVNPIDNVQPSNAALDDLREGRQAVRSLQGALRRAGRLPDFPQA